MTKGTQTIEIGDTYNVPFPMVRFTESHETFGGQVTVHEGWRPGVEWDSTDEGGREAWADAKGSMVLTVIDRHKLPGKYAERVFYLRHWIDPEGREFGIKKLRITTVQNFRNLARGYRYEYELSDSWPDPDEDLAEEQPE